ncbi:MAG: hypothetical protein ABWJ42_03295 [Sulfolobales archaeon]
MLEKKNIYSEKKDMGDLRVSSSTSIETLAVVLIVVILISLTPAIFPINMSSLLANDRTSVAENPLKRDSHNTSIAEYRFIDILIPVSSAKNLVGMRIDRVVAFSCYDDTIMISVKMIPRGFTRTLLVSTNTTVLIPDAGDGVLNESDILILTTPIPREPSNVSVDSCDWSRLAAKRGLRERVIVTLTQRSRVIAENITDLASLGLERFRLALYFDHDPTRTPGINTMFLDISALERVGRALGVEKPSISTPASREEEAEWNKWIRVLKQRVIELRLGEDIELLYEKREAFLYDPVRDRVLTEISSRESLSSVTNIQPSAYLIDGGGGPLRFYEFLLTILNKTTISYDRTIDLYMGYNVYDSVLYVRANSSSITTSQLGIIVRVVDIDSGIVVWSSSYSYTLYSSPTDIFILPYTPYTSTQRLNISITFSWISGSQPYVVIANLITHKTWDSMPTNQTRKGFQLLGSGTISLRDPSATSYPTCPMTRAASMIDPSVYGFTRPELNISTDIKSLTLDSVRINGLYYDSLYNTSPILYLEICVLNQLSQTVSGSLTVKINSVTYATREIQASPPIGGYTNITLFLGSNPVGGYGSLITVEHTLPDSGGYVRIYIDVLIEYQYAPEVWRPDKYLDWAFTNYLPWLKITINENTGTVTAWRSSVALFSQAFSERVGETYMMVRHLISTAGGSAKVLDSKIYIRPPAPGTISPVGCEVRYGEFVNYEKYIGTIVTVWGLVSLGIDFAILLGVSIPEPVSKAIAATSFLAALLGASATTTSVDPPLSDGTIVCSWSSGINSYSVVELKLHVAVNVPAVSANPTFSISILDNGELWYVKSVSVKIPYYTNTDLSSPSSVPMELYYGFYGRSDILYD